MKRRAFKEDAFEHIYQRTEDRGLVFYSDIDFIHFFTIICTIAKKHKITIVAISLMVDHFHMLLISESVKTTADLMRDCTSSYALDFNDNCRRKGRLWQKSYGKALKTGDKAKRTAVAYVNNNGIEKQLCSRTEEYRWNFLEYCRKRNPFSEPIRIKEATPSLIRALAVIRRYHELNLPLGKNTLKNFRSKLDDKEWLQACDYAISIYNIIDYRYAVRLYGDFETMLTALNSNTGSEYEIREERNSLSDAAYSKITKYLIDKGMIDNDPYEILRLPETERIGLAELICREGIATPYQIRKYLHLKAGRQS